MRANNGAQTETEMQTETEAYWPRVAVEVHRSLLGPGDPAAVAVFLAAERIEGVVGDPPAQVLGARVDAVRSGSLGAIVDTSASLLTEGGEGVEVRTKLRVLGALAHRRQGTLRPIPMSTALSGATDNVEHFVIDERDVEEFGRLSSDDNPVHFSDSAAKAVGMQGRVCHGRHVTELAVAAACRAAAPPARFAVSTRLVSPVYVGRPFAVHIAAGPGGSVFRVVQQGRTCLFGEIGRRTPAC